MQHYTLWEFRSASSPQIVRSMREFSRTDRQYQHDYQRILWQGAANSATEAWFKSGFTSATQEQAQSAA